MARVKLSELRTELDVDSLLRVYSGMSDEAAANDINLDSLVLTCFSERTESGHSLVLMI